jgi:hypothetical protein
VARRQLGAPPAEAVQPQHLTRPARRQRNAGALGEEGRQARQRPARKGEAQPARVALGRAQQQRERLGRQARAAAGALAVGKGKHVSLVPPAANPVHRARTQAQHARDVRRRLPLVTHQQHRGARGRMRALRRAHHLLQHPTLGAAQPDASTRLLCHHLPGPHA